MKLESAIAAAEPMHHGVSSLGDDEFRTITGIASDEAGLAIPDSKKALVQSRLSKRMRAIGIEHYTDYVALVSAPENRAERRELISVLTTNVTSFYRESHHFDMLRERLLPDLAQKLDEGQPVRLWSAGCSGGQEPYTIAMECLRVIPDAANRDLLILATDIDPAMLRRAAEGTYNRTEVSGVPEDDLERWFTPSDTGQEVAVKETLRALCRFRELNLHGPWPMRGRFDVIFCRNVVIYFDDERQRALWPRFHAALTEGGTLFLGHSERVHPLEGSGFATTGITSYRKT